MSEAKARSTEEPESVLGIIFDHAVLKDGRELPLALTIQAIAPERPETPDPSDMPRMTPGTSAGLGGGANLGPMSDPNAGVPGRVESPNSVYVPDGQLSPNGGTYPKLSRSVGNRRLGTRSGKPRFIFVQSVTDHFRAAQRAFVRQNANDVARAGKVDGPHAFANVLLID